jgi:hypothetical protein
LIECWCLILSCSGREASAGASDMNDAPEFFLEVDNEDRFREAIRRFDDENARDPNVETVEGATWPRELLHARRLSRWVMQLCPNATEHLRLASRCQHICRWQMPREKYPMDRAGYLRWRNALKAFHANKAGEILREVGYLEQTIAKVQDLNLKKNFPHDPESRVLEDALCLIFLEHQLAPLAEKTTEEKILNALRKSWTKMTERARETALKLPLASRERTLLEKALNL